MYLQIIVTFNKLQRKKIIKKSQGLQWKGANPQTFHMYSKLYLVGQFNAIYTYMYMHNHLLTIMKIISFRLALGGGGQAGLAALCVCVFVHACMHVLCVCTHIDYLHGCTWSPIMFVDHQLHIDRALL